MKKYFLFAALLAATTSFAQHFQLGLKGGINISNFTGGDFSTVKNKALLGYHAGGFMRFKFGGFALQPEALFSSQGAKLDSAGSGNVDYKVSYFNIPVMLQLETTSGLYLEAGPQIGFKINENIPNSTIDHFAKNTDLSVGFGIGYHTPFGLGIGGRYNVGISKVGNFDAGNINPDFKNGVAQISLFYTLFNNK